MNVFLISAIFLSLVIDSTLISVPIVFALCILLFMLEPKLASLAVIFLAGIFLDMLRLTPIGSTSLFLLISCGLIYLYRNTFDLKDLPLVVLLPFVFSYIYALLFGYNTNILIFLTLLLISEGFIYYLGRSKKSMIHAS